MQLTVYYYYYYCYHIIIIIIIITVIFIAKVTIFIKNEKQIFGL